MNAKKIARNFKEKKTFQTSLHQAVRDGILQAVR
jgi:hypothetical protein